MAEPLNPATAGENTPGVSAPTRPAYGPAGGYPPPRRGLSRGWILLIVIAVLFVACAPRTVHNHIYQDPYGDGAMSFDDGMLPDPSLRDVHREDLPIGTWLPTNPEEQLPVWAYREETTCFTGAALDYQQPYPIRMRSAYVNNDIGGMINSETREVPNAKDTARTFLDCLRGQSTYGDMTIGEDDSQQHGPVYTATLHAENMTGMIGVIAGRDTVTVISVLTPEADFEGAKSVIASAAARGRLLDRNGDGPVVAASKLAAVKSEAARVDAAISASSAALDLRVDADVVLGAFDEGGRARVEYRGERLVLLTVPGKGFACLRWTAQGKPGDRAVSIRTASSIGNLDCGTPAG